MSAIIRVGLRISSPYTTKYPYSVKGLLRESHGEAVRDGEAVLDLTIAHLITSTVNQFDYDDSIPFGVSSVMSYQPLEHIGVELDGWNCSADYKPTSRPMVAKVQPFAAGGFEVVMSYIDMDKLTRNMDAPPNTGKREPRVMDENNLVFSASRSKKKVRHLISSLGCDRLLTLTRRESTDFWNVEDWLKAWQRFRLLAVRSGHSFDYVLVLERHKKGNYHAHAAVSGHIKINPLRALWWVCCGGRGMGNLDIQYKPNMTQYKRRQGVARYVSKYITKQLGQTEFNRKRYWSTRHALPPVKRYVLTAQEVGAALVELAGVMGLKVSALLETAFVFPNQSGAWFSFDESMDEPPPF